VSGAEVGKLSFLFFYLKLSLDYKTSVKSIKIYYNKINRPPLHNISITQYKVITYIHWNLYGQIGWRPKEIIINP